MTDKEKEALKTLNEIVGEFELDGKRWRFYRGSFGELPEFNPWLLMKWEPDAPQGWVKVSFMPPPFVAAALVSVAIGRAGLKHLAPDSGRPWYAESNDGVIFAFAASAVEAVAAVMETIAGEMAGNRTKTL